jgi:hypothetical protein
MLPFDHAENVMTNTVCGRGEGMLTFNDRNELLSLLPPPRVVKNVTRIG